MSSNQSFQLPDLLGIINTLELRTNGHCRFATDASEKWFAEVSQVQASRSHYDGAKVTVAQTRAPLLSETELAYLHSTKLGLLCALCFPASDSPQLRVMTDLVTLLFYSAMGRSRSRESDSLGRSEIYAESSLIYSKGGIDLLKEHRLLRHILDQRIVKQSLSKASQSWTDRFTSSVYVFFDAQETLSSRLATTAPIEEYIEFRRELYGTSLILDLAELLEIFERPQVQGPLAEKIVRLKRAALDVLAWSMDVVSYQLNQSRPPANLNLNLVSALMIEKELSLQGAMKLSGSMIRDAFSDFCAAEKDILEYLEPPPVPGLLPTARSTLSVTMSTLSSSASSLFSWMWGTNGEDALSGPSLSPSSTRQETLRVNSSEVVGTGTSTPSISISPSPSLSSLSSSSSSDSSLSPGIDHATVKRYIQALKDCIIGTTHWAYETELFFGKKGAEVRAFGWVFVDQVPVIPA